MRSGIRGPWSAGLPLLVARVALGAQFLRLGVAKLGDPVAFLKLVREYGVLPEPHGLNLVAIVVPWLEVWLAALLLLGVAVRGVGLAMLVLLAGFSTAIAVRTGALADAGSLPFCEVAFDCGCGTGVVVACHKLLENGVLMLLCGVALAARTRRWCLRP